MGKGSYDEIGDSGQDPKDLAIFTILVVVTQVINHSYKYSLND